MSLFTEFSFFLIAVHGVSFSCNKVNEHKNFPNVKKHNIFVTQSFTGSEGQRAEVWLLYSSATFTFIHLPDAFIEYNNISN